MTEYDPAARRVAYVIVSPGRVTTEIRIRVAPAGPSESRAEVEYRLTALTDHGNDHIAAWLEHFPAQAPHWERAVNGRLASIKESRP